MLSAARLAEKFGWVARTLHPGDCYLLRRQSYEEHAAAKEWAQVNNLRSMAQKRQRHLRNRKWPRWHALCGPLPRTVRGNIRGRGRRQSQVQGDKITQGGARAGVGKLGDGVAQVHVPTTGTRGAPPQHGGVGPLRHRACVATCSSLSSSTLLGPNSGNILSSRASRRCCRT